MTAAAQPTVLVVDDDLTIRELVAEVLRSEGYRVLEAGDAATAVRTVEQHAPPADNLCLVLLDIRLRGSDGGDVLRRIESLGAPLPVVFLTASADHLLLARERGQDAIAKPFDIDTLLAVVARHCTPLHA